MKLFLVFMLSGTRSMQARSLLIKSVDEELDVQGFGRWTSAMGQFLDAVHGCQCGCGCQEPWHRCHEVEWLASSQFGIERPVTDILLVEARRLGWPACKCANCPAPSSQRTYTSQGCTKVRVMEESGHSDGEPLAANLTATQRRRRRRVLLRLRQLQ